MVEIREVTTKKQLKLFIDYPNHLYKDVPQYIPSLYADDLADWDREKNPAFSYCDAKAFLAYRDGEIVGRIGAILSRKANETWNTKRMRFSQVDFIDDPEVSAALFGAVEKWALEMGCDQVHGPLGFCDLDKEGMLVKGFSEKSLFITYYNHEYYNVHLEALGYKKDVDWVEMRIAVPQKNDPAWEKLHKISEYVLKKGKYHKADIRKRSGYKPYLKKVFSLLNEAYAHLYGVVELTAEQVDKYSEKFIPLVNPDYCCMVMDVNEEMAGFGVGCPSLGDAMKKSSGRLFPAGWISLLKALNKNTELNLLLIAVRPELQNTGINAVIIDHIMNSCIKNGIKYAESGPQLEANGPVISQWSSFASKQHKRRRCYIKNL